MALKVGELFASFDLDASGMTGTIRTIETQLEGIGADMIRAGSTLSSMVTDPLKGIGKSILSAGMDFTSQMSRVEAISGASAAEMEKLNAEALKMGSTTQFTATEAGQALEYMAMAGWKTSAMINGLEPIMNLAAASGENLADVSDIVTDAMTAFGLEAKKENIAGFSDVLAQAASNSNTNVGLMGETFKYVAPVAGALGYGFQDGAEISNEQAVMVAGLIVAGMADGLQERYPELYEAGQAAVEQFEDAFGNGTDALIALCNSLGIEIPASLADALGDESIWNSASDALNTGMEQITGAVGDFMETAGKADMGRYGSGAEQGTESAKNSVVASMNTTTDPENFTTAASNAQTTGENIGVGVSDGVSGKETDIATAVQGLVASMNTTFEPTVQSFGNTARMAMTNVSIGIQAMQGNAALSARNAGNAVVNAMRGSLNGSTGYSLGNDLMRGIISGINSMAGMLSSAARTVVRNAVAAMRKAADAHSPSRETLALGQDMDEGGAIGLSGGMMAAAATQAVKDTIRAMTAQTRLSDPSVGTVMTARANARQTAAETANSLSDGENREAYASAVGRMIADRLIESGALGGDVVMDGEKVGRKTAPTVSKSIADKAKKTVSGRSAQGVLI